MVRIALIGNVPPQSTAVAAAIAATEHDFLHIADPANLRLLPSFQPTLIVVAGWRRLIPPDILRLAPTVGFHSAKLPEYPGRAPVPWTLIRGDDFAYNTLFYLDDGIDSGDIIAERRIRVYPSDTPDVIYYHMGRTAAEMLTEHLPALLDGTAPRTPQDRSRRGPLTTADGWALWQETRRVAGRV